MTLRTSGNGRRYWVTTPLYLAKCRDCNWESEHKNAKGSAALHHDRTQHTVSVEEIRTTVYQTEESYQGE